MAHPRPKQPRTAWHLLPNKDLQARAAVGGALLGVLRNRRKHVVGGELAEATAPVSCRAPAQPPRLPLPALQHHRRPPAHALPSSYHHSLRVLRWACTAPWLPPSQQLLHHAESLSLTLRSLKSCLLATAAQRELLKENRRLQRHHRDSAALNSRDDTI